MAKLTSLVMSISLVANVCSLFAMDLALQDQKQRFMLQSIRDPQDLNDKLGATYKQIIATIEQHGIQLATMPQNSVYALISDPRGELAAFIGCHQEEQSENRVILDKLYLRLDNDTTHKRMAPMLVLLLCCIFEKHSKAQTIWIPLEKTSNIAKFLQPHGFRTSQYCSKHHDPATFQGWEVDILALTQAT